MDFLKLPPEIMETIFLKLDPQALAACALAEKRLAKVIYSSHLLDAYCRKTLSCPWITAKNIEELNIPTPFQFWFMVYTTLKTEEVQGKLYLQNSILTRIGTFKDMFIMWLVCGHRSSYLDSYALMNVLYPLPATVEDVFPVSPRPEPVVTDTLIKVFYSFPEIMQISCGDLKLFQMQRCVNKPLLLQNVYVHSIASSLPKSFTLLHSVEIVSSACYSGHPTVIVLIAQECWVLWLGTISTSSEEVSVVSKLSQHCFEHSINTIDIREQAQFYIRKLLDQIRGEGSLSPVQSGFFSPVSQSLCPIISGENSDIANLVMSLAQESNRSLQQKFLSTFKKNCQTVINNVKDFSEDETRSVLKHFNYRPHPRNQIDDYILKILQTNITSVRMHSNYHMPYAIYKSILERLACLYRNETHSFIENPFCHSFLCDCVGPSVPVKTPSTMDAKIEKCVSSNVNDGIFSPCMWPPHVISTACQLVPVLTQILQQDMCLTKGGGPKCAVPCHIVETMEQKLYHHGLTFTIRPPSKPRCPPLLKQVRLFIPEYSCHK